MLIHVNDAVTLQGARALRQPLIIPYGIHQEYELQIVTGHGNSPVDIESRGCVKWTLTITPSPENPTKVLTYAVFAENIATGSYLRFDFAATSVEMYKHVAGNPATPAVLQLQGFTEEDAPATLVITLPVALVTTAQQRLPVDLSTALMQELQLAVSVVGAAQREISKYAGESTDAADRAELAAINAHASEVNAEHSATAAGTSAVNARNAEDAAAGSAAAALASQNAAHDSEVAAKASEDAAALSESNAHDSEVAAKASEDAAALSESNAKDSEDAAKASENAAALSESNAHSSELAASASAADALASQNAAAGSAAAALASQNAAAGSAAAALASQNAAHASEVAAKASEDAALASQNAAAASQADALASKNAAAASQADALASKNAAALSETNAHNSEVAAKASEDAAKLSEQHAKASEDAALLSEQHASASETNAHNSEVAAAASQADALASKNAAKGSEDAAAASAKLSESWAKGDTGVRDDEDTNNAKYWAEQSRSFSPITKADKVTGGDTDGMVAGLDAEGNLTNTEIPSDNVAQKDGYYAGEGFGAATAENLVDPYATPSEASYGFRTTAGDISISEHGVADITEIRGRTEVPNQLVPEYHANKVTGNGSLEVMDALARAPHALELRGAALVKNQLVQNGDFSDGTTGWVAMGGVSISVSAGVLTADWSNATSGMRGVRQYIPTILGHTYLVTVELNAPSDFQGKAISVYDSITPGTNNSVQADPVYADTWHKYVLRATRDRQSATLTYFGYHNNITFSGTVQIRNVQFVDLTQLFNGDTAKINAVQTWEDLVAVMPEYGQYAAYNTGEVVGSDAGWEHKWGYTPDMAIQDKYLNAGGALVTHTSFCCTDYIPVQPGCIVDTTYPHTAGSGGYLHFYTSDKTLIPAAFHRHDNVYNATYTVPEGAAYVRDSFLKTDINTYQLWVHNPDAAISPTAPLFAAGTAYDSEDVVAGKRTQRIGRYVVTGNETFNAPAAHTSYQQANGCDAYILIPGIKGNMNAATANVLSNQFPFAPTLLAYENNYVNAITGYANQLHIKVANSLLGVTDYTQENGYTTPPKFQAYFRSLYEAGTPLIIYYELATPVVTDITPTPVTLQAGTNTFTQTSGVINGTPIYMKYDGMDYAMPANTSFKYITRINGVWSYSTGLSVINVVCDRDQVFDLTLWYRPGNEPKSMDAFYKLNPQLRGVDVPYSEGYIAGFNGTAVRSVFFNAYNHATGTAELIGGNEYQICGTYTEATYTDLDGTVETLSIDEDGIFTPQYNGTLAVTGGNDTDTCVHLTWSGYRNYGEPQYQFEPYGEFTRQLPIAEHFDIGMHGIGTVCDELYVDKAVHRFVLVDMGTLPWSVYSSTATSTYPFGRWDANLKTIGAKPNGSGVTSRLARGGRTTDRTFIIANAAGEPNISIFDSELIGMTTRAQLQAALSGVYLLVELATPVVTTIDPQLNLSYAADDFGTEELLPRNTTTIVTTQMDALIRYNLDFTRLGVHLSEMYPAIEDLYKNNDKFARTYGDYPEMGAGYARNLIDPNARGVERRFSVDTSCGTASISDNGNAVPEMFRGRTLNWNQRCSATANWGGAGAGNTKTVDADTHMIVYDCRNGGVPYYLYYPYYAPANWKNSHIYLETLWVRWDGVSQKTITLHMGAYIYSSATADLFDGENVVATAPGWCTCTSEWRRITFIRRAHTDIETRGNTAFMVQNSPKGVLSFRDMQIFDLTMMFGYGKEPRKIADFRVMFPEPWYDRDTGTVMAYKGTGIKTVGFNQYTSANEYIRVRPQAYQITGTYTAMNYSSWPLYTAPTPLSINQATVRNTLYSYQNFWYTAYVPIEEYSSARTYAFGEICIHDGTWFSSLLDITTAEEWDPAHWTGIAEEALGNTRHFHSHAMIPDDSGVFLPPDFGWLYVAGGNDTDTCVHFTWSGYRNGDYEPYWESVRDFNVTQYFPEGMNGVQSSNSATSGYVCDELYNDKYVQRIYKKVFTGDESFSTGASGTGVTNNRFEWSTGTGVLCRDTTRNSYYDVFSNYFVTGFSATSGGLTTEQKAIANGTGLAVWGNASNYILQMVPPTTWGTITTADAFKAKLKELYDAGKPLVVWYILKTPVVTPINPPQNFTYKVADFGTEAALPPAPASFPVDAVIKYSTDYTRELTHMIDEDIRGRVDALDEQMPDKADKNGDYRKDGLVANAAGNLIDEHADPVPAQFTFRTTAGEESVAAEGVAEMQACRGTTHTFNQLAEDYHVNTMDAYSEGAVGDARGGSPEANLFLGETIVTNQLVPESAPATADAVNGQIEVAAAFAGNADGLTMYGDAYVRNQQINHAFFGATNNWSVANATFQFADNECLATKSSDTNQMMMSNSFARNAVNGLAGHTYIMSLDVYTSVATTMRISGYRSNPVYWAFRGDVTNVAANTWTRLQARGLAEEWFDMVYAHFELSNEYSIGATVRMRNYSLVDLTQLCNGDATKIAAIQTWDDLVAQYPEYASYVPYDTGTVVGLQPSVVNYGDEYAYGIIMDTTQSTVPCQRVELHNGVISNVDTFSSMPAHDWHRCVMDDLATRHVNYYLDPADSTKKYNGTYNGVTSNGSASVLTGADGDVMVEMNITHWRVVENYGGAGKHLYLVSDRPFTGSEIHPFFYTSPNGDTPRTQYVGAYRAVVCDENGTALNTTEGVYSQNAGDASTRKARSVAGALTWSDMTLADVRTASARNGGSHVNFLAHTYIYLMMVIDAKNFNTQSGISGGFSFAQVQSGWWFRKKTGRTNYGNGTGNTLAQPDTADVAIFYSFTANNVTFRRSPEDDANGYFGWSTFTATASKCWTASALPGNGAVVYADTAGTDSGYTTSVWRAVGEVNQIIQFQYRGIEDPFGAFCEFEDGFQRWYDVEALAIKNNSNAEEIYARDSSRDTASSYAWTNQTAGTIWTSSAVPGNNSAAYTDAERTASAGFSVTVSSYNIFNGEYWYTCATNDYTSTEQHGNADSVYFRVYHQWPPTSATGWPKQFDPRTFLPMTIGGYYNSWYFDSYNSDYIVASRIRLIGGYANGQGGNGYGLMLTAALGGKSVIWVGRTSA